MRAEYLLLNILIAMGPVILSFDRTVRFFRYWFKAWISCAMVMIPFVMWDSSVSGVHWFFNDKFTLPFRLLGLPLGEYLFFMTVPFACLFIWQILVTKGTNTHLNITGALFGMAGIFCIGGIVFWVWGKIYTAFVCMALVLTILCDRACQTAVLNQKRTYHYLSIVTGLTLIFNGYLTARPVVLYNPKYFTDIRLWTVPIEDFGYGYALILLCTIVFEKLKGLNHA